jgi:tetratricopeptide (TPR) repeat protein
VYSVILGYYGMATGLLGDFEEGEALCEKALRFALETGDPASLAMIHHSYGWMLNFKGDGKNVVEHLQESIRYSEEIQFIAILGHLNSGLGWGYYLLGDMETAREHAEKAIRIQGDTGIPFLLSCAYHTLSVVHLDSGSLQEARRCADEALELSQNNNEKWAEGVSRILLGRVLGKVEKSQFTEAEECILQGIKIQDELRLKPWSYTGCLYLGELYANTGQREKALETLKKAQAMFQEMGMDYWLRQTQEVLEKVKENGKALQGQLEGPEEEMIVDSNNTHEDFTSTEIRCPICGSETVTRTSKQGPNAGSQFHMCISYPECKGKIAVE